MAVESQPYGLGQAMGLDSRWKGAPNTAAVASDLWYDPRGGWRTCGGYRRILLGQFNQQSGQYVNPFASTGKIWSLHRFSQHNGARQWLLFEADDGTSNPTTATLYYMAPWLRSATPYEAVRDRNGDQVTGRTIVTTPWQRTTSCTWGDRIYLLNGIDTPLVFDGRMADRAGFDVRPSAPTAREIESTTATYYDSTDGGPVPDLGIGPVPAALTDPPYVHQRRYVVTFINSRGEESPPSEASNTVEVKTGISYSTMGANFHWLEIPVGGTNVVARRIYATDNMVDASGNPVIGRGEIFYFLKTVEDNDTRGLEIFQGDAYLGAELDPMQYGLWPAGAKFAVSFKGCMFLAGMNDTEVRHSRAGYPETYPPANLIPLGDAHLGPVTGMVAARNAVIVFKAQGVYLIKGDPVSGFYAETLDHAHGCLSPRAIVEIPNVGVAWIHTSGIYMLEGTLENEGVLTRVKPLSTPLYDESLTWNEAALINAVGVLNSNDSEAWFAIPTLGSQDPDKVYVFHYDIGHWTTREGFPISCAVTTADHRNYVLFGSYDTNHLGIHVYSRGFAQKDDTSDINQFIITPVYETNPLDLSAMFLNPAPTQVDVFCVGYGDLDMTLDYRTARRTGTVRVTDAGSTASAKDQQYPESRNRMAVFGTAAGDYLNPNSESEVAIWGTSTWGEWRPIMLRFDVSTAAVSPIHEFAIRLSVDTNAVDMQIIGLQVWIRGGELQKTKLLSTLLGPSSLRGAG